jgi:iron complex transport system ATP-binding protein
MLFGDGDYLRGPLSQVLTGAKLERLYGCPIREISDGPTRYYLPG